MIGRNIRWIFFCFLCFSCFNFACLFRLTETFVYKRHLPFLFPLPPCKFSGIGWMRPSSRYFVQRHHATTAADSRRRIALMSSLLFSFLFHRCPARGRRVSRERRNGHDKSTTAPALHVERDELCNFRG